jgi:hypothetical protein
MVCFGSLVVLSDHITRTAEASPILEAHRLHKDHEIEYKIQENPILIRSIKYKDLCQIDSNFNKGILDF